MSVTPAHGILLVDKPSGGTSHDTVARMRRLAQTRRVGHAGTLDPMATGLLLIGVGQGTRLLTHMVGLPKVYEATIRLGQGTVTDDAEGEPVGEIIPVTGLDDAAIEAALNALRGDILQVPSAVSAIKVDGRRSYARVRAEEDVQLAARPVTIRRFEVLGRRDAGPFVDLDVVVDCSSGTYIRALARDLGASLGTAGHLTALRRTSVGPFSVDDAVVLPPRGEDDHEIPLRGLGESASAIMPPVVVDGATAVDLGHGKRPTIDVPAGAGRAAAVNGDGALVAVIEPAPRGTAAPVLVVPVDART